MNVRRGDLVILFLAALVVNWVGTMWWLSGGSLRTAWASGAAQVAPQAVDGVQAAAAIPRTFSYQGTLRDKDGKLLNGSFKITLKLYNVVTGGSALYTEVFDPVVVRSGVFSVVVGDKAGNTIPANLFDNAQLFLGISVGADSELLPRQRLHPVPWAMQASTALNAATANNLVQGGGVPGIVTLGAGGAKEIAFAGGTKITDSPAGTTISGAAGAVAISGDLTVNGDWSAGAILDKGDSNGGQNQRSTYPVNINRYVVEAPDNGASPDTVPLDDAILTDFCQDADGCTVSLYMRDWDPASEPGLLAGVGPSRLSLAPVANGKRQWDLRDVASNFAGGTDNNGAVNHAMNIYNACLFTDGEYVNAQGSDSKLGFGLLNWAGAFDSVKMTCVLIIED
jgi:hypothetical protein